jgi:2-polyprenyl-6-methoxyphenol hydroxylase-like FAD-dependent oxidoreductase
VVGAGPAGALAALHLSRLGWRVRVLDASAAPLGDAPTENAVVSKRGLAALRDAGVALSAERDGATTLEGAVRYRVQHDTVVNESVVAAAHRTTQFKGSVVVKRGALARAIRRATLKPPPPLRSDGDGESESDSKKTNVSFEFGKTLRFLNLDSKLARFEVHETKTEESVAYDLLVGADGSASATRAALENEGALTCERNADGLYSKTACLPPGFFEQTARVSVREGRNSGTGSDADADADADADCRDSVARERIRITEGCIRKRRLARPPARLGTRRRRRRVRRPERGKTRRLVRVDRRRASVVLETRPNGVGRRDASRRPRARRVRVSRRRRRRRVQSASARRHARRRVLDGKRRLDDVLAPDPPRRLGGARRRRRALGVADARAKHGRDAGNLGVPGRRARESANARTTKGESRRGRQNARVVRRTFPQTMSDEDTDAA